MQANARNACNLVCFGFELGISATSSAVVLWKAHCKQTGSLPGVLDKALHTLQRNLNTQGLMGEGETYSN